MPVTHSVARRRLAAGTAGSVIALTALIAVPAAGALSGAAGPLAAQTTSPRTATTTPWTGCGGAVGEPGKVKPLCTRTPTGTPTGLGRIDFEDRALGGWTSTDPRIKLKVAGAVAAFEGKRGLRVEGLDKADGTASLRVTEGQFASTGLWREITLKVRVAKLAVLPSKRGCGGVTPKPFARGRLTFTLVSGSETATRSLVADTTSWRTVTLQVPFSTTGEVTLSMAFDGWKLDSPVFVDSVRMTRVSAPSTTPTSTASPSATATGSPSGVVVQPLCTTKPSPSRTP